MYMQNSKLNTHHWYISPPFPPPLDTNQPERRKSNEASSRNVRPLSTEASIIPGESEEDGDLRREYVMVGDTRAIEFNKTGGW